MKRVTPPIRHFATRLVIHATGGKAVAEVTPAESFQVCQRLQLPLSTLMGSGGFRALLTRALALAKEQVPWLHAVHVNADGTLEGLDEVEKQVEPKHLSVGSSVLLAELLGLMVAFIGAALTVGLVREVWPEIKVDDSEFVSEGTA